MIAIVHPMGNPQTELVTKQERLAVSAAEAGVLLRSITASTATAEKEKMVVTGIVEQVSFKAAVWRVPSHRSA